MKLISWLAVGASVLGAAVPPPVRAQGRPLTVTGVRGITFGAVLPGVPRVIPRTDPANSGQLDIRGPNQIQVLLTFILPLTMTGPAGALMPLTFSSADAGYSQSQSIASQVGFDPRQPFTATLSNNGRGSVFVGATASPAANQRAGAYTATITLTVTVLP
ncbi:MAG TPA: hypothetical protein VGQ25_11195 [Gemmatimonadales bacterium]|jgi:hypothetical protein|nr:hypothetical protein [Gemmatimonadales bacterium]